MALFDQQYPKFHTDPDRVDFAITIPILAAGAVGTIAGSPGFTVAHGTAGQYNVTCPKCVDFWVDPVVNSPTTVFGAKLTARSAANGTFTVLTLNAAGAATDPANGDEILVTGTVKYKGV